MYSFTNGCTISIRKPAAGCLLVLTCSSSPCWSSSSSVAWDAIDFLFLRLTATTAHTSTRTEMAASKNRKANKPAAPTAMKKYSPSREGGVALLG